MRIPTARGRRSFTYSIIILLVISIFVLGYLFYFIPTNTKRVQDNGFLILRTIATNISNAANGRAKFYGNLYEEASTGKSGEERRKSIDSLLTLNDVMASAVIFPSASQTFRDSAESEIRLGNGSFVVSVAGTPNQDSVEFTEPMEHFLVPFLSTQKRELFQSYVFGKLGADRSVLIYKDEELPLRTDVGLDSLFPNLGKEYLGGMHDVVSDDMKSKMFYYPFNIREKQYVICGFVDSATYQSSLRTIPFYFIYPLAIVFLLLVVSLPILKFYVMDSNEQVRIRDVQWFGISAFLCASLITLIIIQFLLWKGEEKRVESNLGSIANQIKDRFKEEVQQAYAEMEALDKLLSRDKIPLKENFSDSIRSYLAAKNKEKGYYYFDRISWVDSAGNQRVKGELHSPPVFINVAARNYFKVFKQGTPYDLPGHRRNKFGWEAINSWTNGDFNMTISMKRGEYLTAIATKMHSLLNVLLPSGYGFCIIDEQGNVQVHSDPNRNLRENFFRKVSPAGRIRGAVASRQFRMANDVVAYGGKLHMMSVQPLQPSMPFYLVTFYDKGNIVPINMRILVFTLVFCLISFLICLLLWWTIGWRNPKNNPLLFCSMDFLSWMIPKEREKDFYFHGSLFLFFYLACIAAFVFASNPLSKDNFSILALVTVTPVNILLGLHCIRTALTTRHEFRQKRDEVGYFVAGHLFFSILVFGFIGIGNDYSKNYWTLLFQLVLTLIMFVYVKQKSGSRLLSIKPGKHRINEYISYNLLLTLIIISLAVLPSALFTWYAHNQELKQSARRQQLHLARSILSRSFEIQEMKGIKDTALVPQRYLDSLIFSWGIYRTKNDVIRYDTCTIIPSENTFENIYFDITERVGVPYYDQLSFASLQDYSHDGSWGWKQDSVLHFWYQFPFPARNPSFAPENEKCLHIASSIPRRFVYLNDLVSLFIIVSLISVLLFALYLWLGRNTRRIFLTRYLESPTLQQKHEKTGLIAAYFEAKKIPDEELPRRLYTGGKYDDYTTECDKERLLQYEEEIVEDLKNGKGLYEYVWTNSTEKERYLLYDYADDGLINYKNAKEIIELINKGIFVIHEERLRLFSPGFRAYILNSVDKTEIQTIQKKFRENSTWQFVRIPLLILILGIAAILFFTQQGVFDKILLLVGGVSTLLTIVMRYFGGSGGSESRE